MCNYVSNAISSLDKNIIKALLADKTTKQNIIWATNTYADRGAEYAPEAQLMPELISGISAGVLCSRVDKSAEQQQARTRAKAEVFTPSWICNKMNNHCDAEWFGYPDSFNIEDEQSWRTVYDKVVFPEGKKWQDYIESRRIEITCGEAPYLVSRYDTTTGNPIAIKDRIGIIDRKLRIVNENAESDEEWLKWALKAFQSSYGYEFQGDSVFVARLNLIMTFIEYYEARFYVKPDNAILRKVVNIIVWNLWQMDGLTNTIPYGTPEEETKQLSLFDFMIEPEEEKKETPVCRIYDWKANKSLLFTDLKD